jgi:hypothetical protein
MAVWQENLRGLSVAEDKSRQRELLNTLFSIALRPKTLSGRFRARLRQARVISPWLDSLLRWP